MAPTFSFLLSRENWKFIIIQYQIRETYIKKSD